MLANERETFEFLKWPTKAITTINWFSDGVQASVIVAEHINECKCIKKVSCYMHNNTPEHAVKC